MRHGEAVAIGVAIDTVYSSLAMGLPRPQAIEVLDCLLELGFKLDCPQLRQRRIYSAAWKNSASIWAAG